MKKLILGVLLLTSMQSVFAEDMANIRIKMSGTPQENRYFLCLPNVGCLSIQAGNKGKIYPVVHAIEMHTLYVADGANSLRLSPQGLPKSCNVTVAPNKTITITGHITADKAGNVIINQLNCSVA